MSPHLRFHRTQGQSVVLVALAILVLIALAGLGLDGANAFNQRRNVANAADAASIAGTNALIAQRKSGGSNTPICQAISDYISDHDLTNGVALTWTASYVDSSAAPTQQFCDSSASPVATSTFAASSDKGVSVTIHYTFKTLFMPILGRSDLSVGGTGAAMYGPLSSTYSGDLVPFAISQDAASKIEGKTGFDINITNLGPGNFGSVVFNPSSPNQGNGNDCTSSTYKDTQTYYWCNGSPKYPVSTGEDLPGNPGMISNSLYGEISTRFGDIVYMPVYSGNAGTGSNATFSIIGFIAVKINSATLNGSGDPTINVDYVTYSTAPGSFSTGAIDGGVYAVNLVS